MADDPVVLSAMQLIVGRNLLRFACGVAIECPGCGDVLDCGRAVQFTFGNDERRVEMIRCAVCFDKFNKAAPAGAIAEVLDGRQLWRRR